MSEPETPGVVILFTGNGKGKTTAAIGTAVRAAGHGFKVAIILFMKSSDVCLGEITALSHIPDVSIHRYGRGGWITKNNIRPEDVEQAEEGLNMAREIIFSNQYDLVILDEINTVFELGLIKKKQLVEMIKSRPGRVSLILTGRNANAELVSLADTVTNMSMVKHQYNKGIQAREGLDY